jgi:uncharacterized membrane protein
MLMLPRIAFVVLLVLVPAVIVATSGALPDRVATHFGRGGMVNDWMSRDSYIAFMLAFTILVPLVVVAMTGFLPGIARSRCNIPNYDYWFAPARREASAARLVSHACLLGCLMVLCFGGFHAVLLHANATTPARLSEPAFFSGLAVLGFGITLWMVFMRRLFRRPD